MVSLSTQSSVPSGNKAAVNNGVALSVVTTIFFMWGFSHLPQRHPDSALEGGVRAQLRAGDAGAIHLLRCVLPDVAACRLAGESVWLQAGHRGRIGGGGGGRAGLLAGGGIARVWRISRRIVRAGHRHHHLAGRCQSLRCLAGSGAQRFQPLDPGAGAEFARHCDRTAVGRLVDPVQHGDERRSTESLAGSWAARPIACRKRRPCKVLISG